MRQQRQPYNLTDVAGLYKSQHPKTIFEEQHHTHTHTHNEWVSTKAKIIVRAGMQSRKNRELLSVTENNFLS